MHARTLLISAVTVVALFAAVGTAYRLDAREPRKPYPKATPPPPPSPIFHDSHEPVLSEAQIEELARDHDARLEREIERALVGKDEQKREAVFTFLMPELLQLAPERAVAMLERQEPGEARDLLLDEIARQWIGWDREAAIRWMQSIEDDVERERAARTAVDYLAAIEPEQAMYVAQQVDIRGRKKTPGRG